MNIGFDSFLFDEDVLGRQLGVPLSPRSRDLLRIAMYIYAADRLTKRNRISSIMVSTRLRNPPPMKQQELTQRSRSFLFAALGAVVASELGVETVEVYENGVGVINLPPMTGMMFGGRTTKSAHPEFFRRMGALLTAISRQSIEFVLPFRDRTKAELMKRVADDELLVRMAQESVSCVHYPRRVQGQQKQCGVCPGCIGRRQALIIGGICESPEKYRFDVFGRSEDVARIPVRQLAHLKSIISQVELLSCLPDERLLPLAVKVHLAGVLVRGEDQQPAIQLLQRYRDEWRCLIESGLQADRPWAQWHGPISSLSPGSVV